MINRVTFHVWADGHGFYDLGPEANRNDMEFFKDFLRANENQADEGHMVVAGAEIEVVDHPGPFRPQETSLNEAKDAILDQFIKPAE